MKWLTLDWVKAHSRIDFNDDEELLELYAGAAEDTVLNIINRPLEEVYEKYGEVPKPLWVAALLLTDESYNHRSPSSPQNIYPIPNFDTFVKPYMKLTT